VRAAEIRQHKPLEQERGGNQALEMELALAKGRLAKTKQEFKNVATHGVTKTMN